MAYEPAIFLQWSKEVLEGDSDLTALLTGGVWGQTVPPKTPRPYLTRTLAGGPGRLYAEGVRPVWFDGLWYFTVYVDVQDDDKLAAIVSRLDDLLQRASGPTTGGEVLLCVQEGAPIPAPPLAVNGQLITAVAVPYSAQVLVEP